MRPFDSEYSDWSEKISSRMPHIRMHPDNLQLYANFMILVAILNVIPLSVQSYKVYKTKEAKGLSIYAFMFQVVISSLWLFYAIITRNGVIVVSSTLLIIAAVTLVWLIMKYSDEEPDV